SPGRDTGLSSRVCGRVRIESDVDRGRSRHPLRHLARSPWWQRHGSGRRERAFDRKRRLMSRWLSIIGLSEGGWLEVSGLGRSLILAAELIVGGERHLAMLPHDVSGRRIGWSTPLKLTVEEILRHRGRPVVVLATGDPMHFGIGVTFARVL